MKKKITSLLLALTLCLGLLPAGASAEGIPAYGWEHQTPEDPTAITYNMEVADFGTMKYGFTKKDSPTLTISFTNTGNQTLWYIHNSNYKGSSSFKLSITQEGWDSIRVYPGVPFTFYALELKPGSSASVDLTLETGYHGDWGASFPARVYEGDLDFFFATSDEPVGSNQYGPVFKGGNYPLPYRFEVVYDGYMGGGDVLELDRESVEFGVVETSDAVTETVSVTNRAQVELTLVAHLAAQCHFHGDEERNGDQLLSLDGGDGSGYRSGREWTLAPGETAQIQIIKEIGTSAFSSSRYGRYDTELLLSSSYRVEGGGNRQEYRDEKVVPISFTTVKDGNLSVFVALESPCGGSGYLTSADGATTYWGNDWIDVPYGGDLSLNIIPYDPEHGYIVAVERYTDFPGGGMVYIGCDNTLLAQALTDGQRYQVSIASCTTPPAGWAREAVGRAYSLRIFYPFDMPGDYIGGAQGVHDVSYADPITRKNFCEVAMRLYRALRKGEASAIPEDDFLPAFTDTKASCVRELAYLGVIGGVGDGKFDPDGQLTREQAAAILSRLAGVLGIRLDNSAPAFADNGSISSWATDAVGQMQASGIMGGLGNNQFGPQGTYSWEQSIATLMRLYDRTI